MKPNSDPRRVQPHQNEAGSGTDSSRSRVRIARQSDLIALSEMADAFYREGRFVTTQQQLSRNLHILVHAETAHVTIIDIDGLPVAFAVTTISFGLESGLSAELEDLYVVPPQRRRGWAEHLIEEAAGWATDRGATILEVVIAQNGNDDLALHAYYEARGFKDDGRRIRARPLLRNTDEPPPWPPR